MSSILVCKAAPASAGKADIYAYVRYRRTSIADIGADVRFFARTRRSGG